MSDVEEEGGDTSVAGAFAAGVRSEGDWWKWDQHRSVGRRTRCLSEVVPYTRWSR